LVRSGKTIVLRISHIHHPFGMNEFFFGVLGGKTSLFRRCAESKTQSGGTWASVAFASHSGLCVNGLPSFHPCSRTCASPLYRRVCSYCTWAYNRHLACPIDLWHRRAGVNKRSTIGELDLDWTGLAVPVVTGTETSTARRTSVPLDLA